MGIPTPSPTPPPDSENTLYLFSLLIQSQLFNLVAGFISGVLANWAWSAIAARMRRTGFHISSEGKKALITGVFDTENREQGLKTIKAALDNLKEPAPEHHDDPAEHVDNA